MTDKPISLSSARAKKTGLARDWTPKDALEFAIDRVDEAEGDNEIEMACIILTTKIDDDGGRGFQYIWATKERLMKFALLSQALQDIDSV